VTLADWQLDCPLQKTVELLPKDGGASIRIIVRIFGARPGAREARQRRGTTKYGYLISMSTRRSSTRPGNGCQHDPYRRDAANTDDGLSKTGTGRWVEICNKWL
jgi:hypothetical protein